MKINAIKRIIVEDYEQEARPVVQRLAQTLNGFLEQVSQALANQLTLRDNAKCRAYSIDLPAGTSTQTLAWTLNEKPTAVTIGNLTLRGGGAPADVFCLSWGLSTKGIELTFLGLDAAKEHTVVIIAQV